MPKCFPWHCGDFQLQEAVVNLFILDTRTTTVLWGSSTGFLHQLPYTMAFPKSWTRGTMCRFVFCQVPYQGKVYLMQRR